MKSLWQYILAQQNPWQAPAEPLPEGEWGGNSYKSVPYPTLNDYIRGAPRQDDPVIASPQQSQWKNLHPGWQGPEGLFAMDPRFFGRQQTPDEIMRRWENNPKEDIVIPSSRPPFADVTRRADNSTQGVLPYQLEIGKPLDQLSKIRGLDRDVTNTPDALTVEQLMRNYAEHAARDAQKAGAANAPPPSKTSSAQPKSAASNENDYRIVRGYRGLLRLLGME